MLNEQTAFAHLSHHLAQNTWHLEIQVPGAGTWHLVYHQNLTSGVSLKRAFTPFSNICSSIKMQHKTVWHFGNSKKVSYEHVYYTSMLHWVELGLAVLTDCVEVVTLFFYLFVVFFVK